MKKWSLRVPSLSWTWSTRKDDRAWACGPRSRSGSHGRGGTWAMSHEWENLSQESWRSIIACLRAKIMGSVNVLMCSWQIVASLYCLVKCTVFKKEKFVKCVYTINWKNSSLWCVPCMFVCEKHNDFFMITLLVGIRMLEGESRLIKWTVQLQLKSQVTWNYN